MAAPSLDFHCTTSRVARRKSLYCAATSVRYFGAKSATEETKTSGKRLGAAPVAAKVRWSLVKDAPVAWKASGPLMRRTARVAGSMRKRWAAVFCVAAK